MGPRSAIVLEHDEHRFSTRPMEPVLKVVDAGPGRDWSIEPGRDRLGYAPPLAASTCVRARRAADGHARQACKARGRVPIEGPADGPWPRMRACQRVDIPSTGTRFGMTTTCYWSLSPRR